jgi:molybdopterin synthase sulfur carrier subunit
VRQDEGVLTVRYFAAARAAAGVEEESSDAGTLGDLIVELAERRGDRLGKVLVVASFLVDSVAWRDRDAPLPARCTVDVLPPFAGG